MKEVPRSDGIIQSLFEHGVATLFSILGAQTNAFFDALSRHSQDIQLIVSPREQDSASVLEISQPAGYGS